MATDLERLVVQLSADFKKFENEMARARSSANKELTAIERRAKQANTNITKAFSGLGGNKTLLGQLSGLKVALGGFGAALSIEAVRQYADAWTDAENRLRAATQISGVQARSLNDLNRIANETRSGIVETTRLYSKLLISTKDVAKSEQEVADATEIVNKAFKAGGATPGEQASGILQLGQALGSGKLAGDELRSISENATLLAQAIADEFGVTIAELRKLGAEGVLTTDRVFKAILKGRANIEKAFAATDPTLAGSVIQLSNALGQLIHTMDQVGGLTKSFVEQVTALAAAIERFNTLGGLGNFGKIFGITIQQGGVADKVIEWVDGINKMSDAAEKARNAQAIIDDIANGTSLADALSKDRRSNFEVLNDLVQFASKYGSTLTDLNASYVRVKKEFQDAIKIKTPEGQATANALRIDLEQISSEISRLKGDKVKELAEQIAEARKEVAALNQQRVQLDTGEAVGNADELRARIALLQDIVQQRLSMRSIEELEAALTDAKQRYEELLRASEDGKIKIDPSQLKQAEQALIDAQAQLDNTRAALNAMGEDGKKSTAALQAELGVLSKRLSEVERKSSIDFEFDAKTEEAQRKLHDLETQLQAITAAGNEAKESVTGLVDAFASIPKTDPREEALAAQKRGQEFLDTRQSEAAKSDEEKQREKDIEKLADEIKEGLRDLGVTLSDTMARSLAKQELGLTDAANSSAKSISSAADLIKKFEGFVSSAFFDTNAFRVGFSSDTKTDEAGRVSQVQSGDTSTREEAERDLSRRIKEFQASIEKTIGTDFFRGLSESQQAVLTSIAYNFGHLPDALVAALKTGDQALVAETIKHLSDSQPALKSRREEESQLFLSGASFETQEQVKITEAQTKALHDLIAAGKEDIARLQVETELVGKSNIEQERARKLYDLTTEALKAKRAAGDENAQLTEQEIADITALANAYATHADALKTAQLNDELLKESSAELTKQLAEQAAAAQQAAEATAQAIGGAIKDSLKGFVHDLLDGKSAVEALKNALSSLADKLIDIALDNIFNSLGSSGGILGSLFGSGSSGLLSGSGGLYASGGYTGNMPANQPAGVVHGREFVINAEATKKNRKLLEALNAGRPMPASGGYASGGYTGNVPTTQATGVVHGREFVINADATRKNRDLLEAMNKGGYAPGFATGGYVRPVTVGSATASPIGFALDGPAQPQAVPSIKPQPSVAKAKAARPDPIVVPPGKADRVNVYADLPSIEVHGDKEPYRLYVPPAIQPNVVETSYSNVEAAYRSIRRGNRNVQNVQNESAGRVGDTFTGRVGDTLSTTVSNIVRAITELIDPEVKVLRGFASGGFTGNVAAQEAAGIVHGREFVVNADATRKYRPLLEGINSGRGYKDGGYVQPRGYADGGYVLPKMGAPSSSSMARGWGPANVNITVITPDAPSFLESQNQIAQKTNATLQRSLRTR